MHLIMFLAPSLGIRSCLTPLLQRCPLKFALILPHVTLQGCLLVLIFLRSFDLICGVQTYLFVAWDLLLLAFKKKRFPCFTFLNCPSWGLYKSPVASLTWNSKNLCSRWQQCIVASQRQGWQSKGLSFFYCCFRGGAEETGFEGLFLCLMV